MKKNISATMTAEMSAFLFKFNCLLIAGLKAKLVFECEDGVMRAHVETELGPGAAPAPAGHHHHHQRAKAGPARLRRRARRAEAIQAEANADRAGPPCPPAARAGHLLHAAVADAGNHLEYPAEREVHLKSDSAAHKTISPLPVPFHDDGCSPLQQLSVPPDPLPHENQFSDDFSHNAAVSPLPEEHPPLSYSAVTQSSTKTARPSHFPPCSPGGWGAKDPTGGECDSESESEEESSTPEMRYVWHSPSPVRQMLTGTRVRPLCSTPNSHTTSPQYSLPPDPCRPPHVPAASLHHVIQYLHDRAAQNPCLVPRKKRDYGGAYCLEQTSAGTIRHELTSKKQLARRGGYWDMMGEDYYIDSEQSDNSEVEDYEDLD